MSRPLFPLIALVTLPVMGCDATTWLAERLAGLGPEATTTSEEPVALGASVVPVDVGPPTRPERVEMPPPERTVIPELSSPGIEHEGIGPDPATEEIWDCPACGMG